MDKIKKPTRLIATTILMSLILVLIVVMIIGLLGEKRQIQSALELSQKNRERLLITEGVTESLLLVEVRFKEYCTTFEQPVFEDYKQQVKTLAENILVLQQTLERESQEEGDSIRSIFKEKNKESDIYLRLRLITDSLMFSFGGLEENQTEIKKIFQRVSEVKVDTISVTKTRETNRKGLIGKIKTAIVGEKVQENVNTKLLVNTSEELKDLIPAPTQDQLIEELQEQNQSDQSAHIRELIRKVNELKSSEIKLIKYNNNLISEVRKLIDEIKFNIKTEEAKKNNSFLTSVRNATDYLQNILIVLMILACILAVYILILAYKNNKFQNHIITLNKKVVKDSVEKDKFFSIIGHDLMNPFTALHGYSEMLTLSAKDGDKEEVVENSQIVHQLTKRILNLLQNLLVWFRMQNGKMEFTPRIVRIEELVTTTMMMVAPMAQNKEIHLDWSVTNDLSATIDSNMIGSVLQNLVTNAIKFTHKGGKVAVDATMDTNNLNFTVTDTGTGMDEDQQSKLFKLDKNFSSRGTDEEEGTGLGLIICKEFIDAHQGKIWVDSIVGKGSKFCFSIPMV